MQADLYTPVVVAIAIIAGLEWWRRSLRHRAARWVHVTTFVLLAAIAVGVTYSHWALRSAFAAIESADAGNKATMLARGISHAMNSNAIAFACALLAVLVLAVATIRARRLPEGGPVAQTRS